MASIDSITGSSSASGAATLAALSAGSKSSAAAAASSATGASSITGGSSTEQQNRFLALLVAQMKNQDPLSPVDNAQVTSQLAQISTVDGIERLNTTMKAMSGSVDSTQAVQGAALAGRQVLATGNSLTLSQGKGIGGFQLDQAVDNLNIVISDASGNELHHVSLGPQQTGVNGFTWDGTNDAGKPAPDGSYTYKIQALSQGKEVPVTSLSYGMVSGVSRGADGFALNIAGLGNRTLDQVKQIMQ